METTPRHLVERFYNEVWNAANEAVAREILRADFQFRASLGPVRRGPEGFIDYLRSIHAVLAHYECIIDDLIETGTRAAARMRFRGVHQGPFFGVHATGNAITWTGAAFFTTDRRQITELWVLGDIDAIKRQLGAAAVSSFAS
jgi:predicted ester cyclase